MSLKNKTINGVSWNIVGNIARQLLMITTLVVMTHFLSPEEYGVYAILMIFLTFMNLVSTIGTSEAIINLDSPSQRMLSSIFYFNIFIGSLLFSILFVAAGPISVFFENSDLVHLLHLVGLILVVNSFGLTHKACLQKGMLFKKLVIIETTALVISSIIGVISAIYGFGVYSLIAMNFTNVFILNLGLWLYSSWKPSLSFALKDIKVVWVYSIQLIGSSFINFFARQTDRLLISKFIGSGALGIYSVTYRIMFYPIENISRVIFRVIFPAFSEMKHDNKRLKKGYLTTISFISLVSFPLMIGLLACSSNFVDVIFDDKWKEMSQLLMILAPVGLMQSIVVTTGPIYLVKGTTGLMLKVGLISSLIIILSFFIGISFGIKGVAISYAIANILLVYPSVKFAWKQIDLDTPEGAKKIFPFFISSVFMGLGVYCLDLWLQGLNLSSLFILVLQVLCGILLYFSILLSCYQAEMKSLLLVLRDKNLEV